MRKLVLALTAAALLGMPATASAGNGYGKTVQAATGCTYGELVNLVGGPQNHPIAGVGAKRFVEAVVDGQPSRRAALLVARQGGARRPSGPTTGRAGAARR